MDWNIVSTKGIEWVTFKLKKLEKIGLSERWEYRWSTPLSQHHLLELDFICTSEEQTEAKRAILQFADTIMDSCRVEHAPAMLEEKARVQKMYPNEHYTKQRAPFRWEEFKKAPNVDYSFLEKE